MIGIVFTARRYFAEPVGFVLDRWRRDHAGEQSAEVHRQALVEAERDVAEPAVCRCGLPLPADGECVWCNGQVDRTDWPSPGEVSTAPAEPSSGQPEPAPIRQAVVDLPAPTDLWEEGDEAAFPALGSTVRLLWSGDVVLDGNWYSPTEARAAAAGLLAAADAAEGLRP